MKMGRLKKCSGIDFYAILKPSENFKRNWFTNFEIIPLFIFGSSICILMGKHNKKKEFTENTVYSNVPKFTKIHV